MLSRVLAKELEERRKRLRELGVVIGVTLLHPFGLSTTVLYPSLLAIFILSIFNYEINLIAWSMVLHFSSSSNLFLVSFTDKGRWIFLGLMTLKIFMPSKGAGLKRFSTIHVWLLVFCAYILITSANAEYNFSISIQRSISMILLFMAMYLSLWNYINKRSDAERLLIVIIYCSGAYVIFGLIFLVLGGGQGLLFLGRFQGFYRNPNTMGLMLTVQVPMAFWLMTSGKYNRGPWGRLHRILFFTSALALVLSGSRSSIMGVTVGFTVYAALKFKMRSIFYLTFLIIVLGAFLPVVEEAVQTRFFRDVIYREKTVDTFSGRLELWEDALILIKEKPIWGYGFGTSELTMSRYYAIKNNLPQNVAFGMQTHNSIIRMLIDFGYLGILWTLIFLISIGKNIMKLLARAPTEELHLLVLCIATSTIAALIAALFESWVLSAGNVLSVSFWFVTMLVYRFNADIEQFEEEGDTPRAILVMR